MFLSMDHGSPLLGNLTNSKMDRYLHCVGSLENQTCGIEQQKLTTHQIPRRKKRAASVRVCVFGRKGAAREPRKGPWTIQAPLRSLFIGPRHQQNERQGCPCPCRHYGKSRSFHLVMALLHHSFSLWWTPISSASEREQSLVELYTP